MNRSDHIQEFRENESSEGDSNNTDKRLLKKIDTHDHNEESLINADPKPDEKGFCVHLSALSKADVEVGVLEGFLSGQILIQNQ